jgi:hypothetical protein
MAEYLWVFNIGRLRIGWLKYYYAYVLQREPGVTMQSIWKEYYVEYLND